jgi:hypothetical protein
MKGWDDGPFFKKKTTGQIHHFLQKKFDTRIRIRIPEQDSDPKEPTDSGAMRPISTDIIFYTSFSMLLFLKRLRNLANYTSSKSW